MVNMFQMVFPNGIPGAKNTNAIALRMDQTIEPPENSVSVYDIMYKGMKIPKTGSSDDTDKSVSFDVRLDQQWQVYDDLMRYKKMVFDPNLGTRQPDLLTRTTIAVQAVDGANKVVKTIYFKGAKLKSLKIAAFDQNGTDPMRLTLTWIYAKFEND